MEEESFDILDGLDEIDDKELRFKGYFGKLKQAWINEQSTPEILQNQEELMLLMLEKVKEQEKAIEEASIEKSKTLQANMMQIEVDRVKYVLSSYTKLRLKKVFYILFNSKSFF